MFMSVSKNAYQHSDFFEGTDMKNRKENFTDDQVVRKLTDADPDQVTGALQKRPGRKETDMPLAAITFDDGPSDKVTPRVLDLLKQYNVPATFCVTGAGAEKHPELLCRMTAQGCEIVNHSWSHEKLTDISCEEIIVSLEKAEEAIFNACGEHTVFIRPPYGAWDDRVAAVAYVLEKALLRWNVDSFDWKYRDAGVIIPKVLNEVRDGHVILMHDIYLSSYEAAAVIIPELKNRGYELMTAGGILKRRGITVNPGMNYFTNTVNFTEPYMS